MVPPTCPNKAPMAWAWQYPLVSDGSFLTEFISTISTRSNGPCLFVGYVRWKAFVYMGVLCRQMTLINTPYMIWDSQPWKKLCVYMVMSWHLLIWAGEWRVDIEGQHGILLVESSLFPSVRSGLLILTKLPSYPVLWLVISDLILSHTSTPLKVPTVSLSQLQDLSLPTP